MAKPFESTLIPTNPDLTAVLVNHVLDQTKAGHTTAAIETLRLLDDDRVAGPDYTRELIEYLVGLGLEAMLPA